MVWTWATVKKKIKIPQSDVESLWRRNTKAEKHKQASKCSWCRASSLHLADSMSARYDDNHQQHLWFTRSLPPSRCDALRCDAMLSRIRSPPKTNAIATRCKATSSGHHILQTQSPVWNSQHGKSKFHLTSVTSPARRGFSIRFPPATPLTRICACC